MLLDSEVNAFIERLQNSGSFDDCKIIKAYPYTLKPTRLSNAVIAVSPSDINAKNISVGDNCYFGSYTINAGIYIPHEFGTPAISQMIDSIVQTQMEYYPVAISVSGIENIDGISCFKIDCSFTFNAMIGG